ATPVVLEHEAHLISLVQRADTGGFECGGMNEHILAAAVGLDKTEALGCIEEFHSACDAHEGESFPEKACLSRSKRAARSARQLRCGRGKPPCRATAQSRKS